MHGMAMSLKRKNDKPVTMGEQMWQWCENGMNTDCSIIIMENQKEIKTFKLHTVILMMSSRVFQRMFQTDMTESRTGQIKITDIKSRIMEIALKHVYGYDSFYNLTAEDIRDLCMVADKYELVTLIEECAKYTKENLISAENYLMLLKLRTYFINSFYKQDIDSKILNILEEKTLQCISSVENYTEITEEDIIMILNLENCNLKNELNLVHFIDRWARNQIKINDGKLTFADELKIREFIEPNILPLIRFLTLGWCEFLEFCHRFNWLTLHEKEQITLSIKSGIIVQDFPENLSRNKINRCKKLIFGEFQQIDSNDITKGFIDLYPDNQLLPEGALLLKLSTNNIVDNIINPATANITNDKTNNSRPEFSFNFQLDTDDYFLIGIQLFTESNLYINSTISCYHEFRNFKIEISNNKHTLIEMAVGKGCLVKYNTTITEIFPTPIPLEKSLVYGFRSSYLYPKQFMRYRYKIKQINFGNSNAILVGGDFGFVRALILKKK